MRSSIILQLSFASLLITSSSLAQPATQFGPAGTADLLREAFDAYRGGKYDMAIVKFQAKLALDPHSGEAYAGLIRCYLRQEKVDLAYTTATRATTDDPDSIPAHVALGEVLFRQARMGEAERELLRGVNTTKQDAHAFLGLAGLYDAYSMHASARKMLNKAYELAPEDPDVQRAWIRIRPRAEQIKWLEDNIAASSDDDKETRDSQHERLEFLKAREKDQRTCKLVETPKNVETQLVPLLLDPKHFYGYGLPVKINGQAAKLQLDTGASGIFINKRLAQKAGIKPLVSMRYGGIGDRGDRRGYIGYADSIKMGGLEFQNCLVEVSETRSILTDDGLIGTDVFSRYLVTIDFLWQKLRLRELPRRPGEVERAATVLPGDIADVGSGGEAEKKEAGTTAPSGPQDRYIAPEMQNYTKVFRFGHDLLIPTSVGNTPPKLFLIDTGAMDNSISPEAAREVTKVRGDDFTIVKGVSGTVNKVYSADKAVLTFSHFRQENQEMTSIDMSGISRSEGTEVSGILGMTTLRRFIITIDYRDGLVDFTYENDARK
jgi:tetratricopeptide (TPR) repeat protein